MEERDFKVAGDASHGFRRFCHCNMAVVERSEASGQEKLRIIRIDRSNPAIVQLETNPVPTSDQDFIEPTCFEMVDPSRSIGD
ncbi:hypothetical protein P12x_004086 [Tundrisphaera lichenicola]|uniref:hypothetical protein n=1 Tax=Tundrisphaera lichenicola TaxID=2029860 RepID=UPI003EB895CC